MSASGRCVLIGFADALSAPEVAGSLLRAGHSVLAFARRGRPATLERMAGVRVVHVTPPEEDLARCMADVAGVASAAEATMPLDDPAVLICDRALPEDARVIGPRGAQAQLALDKRLQLREAASAGLPVPPWAELGPGGLLSPQIGLPAILKPALAAEETGGRLRRLSPRTVSNEDAMRSVVRSWGSGTPALVQTIVRGYGAGVFGLADEEGVHHLSAHRRIRMMNPAGSGSSACASTPIPSELVSAVSSFMQRSAWRGMFMIEMLRSDDSWWFMELNGRPWGSLALSRRLGYEYPAWALARALNPAASLPADPGFSELLCRNLGRELVHLLFVLRGPRDHEGDWPGRLATIRDLLRPGSHTAWYNRAPEINNVFLYDAWRTVGDQTWAKQRR